MLCDVFLSTYEWYECNCCFYQCLCIIALFLLMGYSALELLPYYQNPLRSCGYSYRNGPRDWSPAFPESTGLCQSPVNVQSSRASRVAMNRGAKRSALTWCGYETLPHSYTLLNDGRKAALIGKWNVPKHVPSLTGGPLGSARYRFFELHFRWGPCDDWGSEHMLNYNSYPLELQLLHIRQEFASLTAAVSSGAPESIAIVSYFFKITRRDNTYLDPVVLNLRQIRLPGSESQLPPFPLDLLAPSFHSGYYSYAGSLSEPPYSQVAVWMLRFKPTLCISSRQLAQFRQLLSNDGPILRNSRPVQLLHDRSVLLYGKL